MGPIKNTECPRMVTELHGSFTNQHSFIQGSLCMVWLRAATPLFTEEPVAHLPTPF